MHEICFSFAKCCEPKKSDSLHVHASKYWTLVGWKGFEHVPLNIRERKGRGALKPRNYYVFAQKTSGLVWLLFIAWMQPRAALMLNASADSHVLQQELHLITESDKNLCFVIVEHTLFATTTTTAQQQNKCIVISWLTAVGYPPSRRHNNFAKKDLRHKWASGSLRKF